MWNGDFITLMHRRKERAELKTEMHRRAYEKYAGRTKWVNVPSFCLSLCVTLLTNLTAAYPERSKEFIPTLCVMTIAVSVLTGASSILNWNKMEEEHKKARREYLILSEWIGRMLEYSDELRPSEKEMIREYEREIKRIELEEPIVNKSITRNVLAENFKNHEFMSENTVA